MVDDRDLFADVLDQLELVAGEEHGGTAGSLAAEYVRERLHCDRVEPCERLVEDEQLRLVHQRRRELRPLLVAVRELLDLRVRPLAESKTLEPARRGRACCTRPSPCRRPKYSSCSPTRIRGYRPRSSGMYPNRSRSARSIGRPSQSTSPLSSSTRPKMARMTVVFPAPFGPRKPSIRPRATETEHPSSACTSPNRLCMSSMASMAHIYESRTTRTDERVSCASRSLRLPSARIPRSPRLPTTIRSVVPE